ncbi:SDR family NAD(P)-dependent oxidoreductase [Scopulibacillus cellulosilyticus]|uniref:SDR family NAD(P)-dependent oxidoreductase n=1 Tax=Scopulibacillus cellulosilyticus TaxID=2665665 RepID=A0ABW2PY05_9BACL
MDYKKIFDLTGKTAIVTGGAVGLGREMAEAIAQFGSNIVVVDIQGEAAEKAAQELKETYNVKTLGIEVDVTREDHVQQMIQQAVSKFNTIDILLNNAGICQKIDALDQDYNDWKKTIDVNINGVFLVAKYVGEVMKENGGGSIINTASMSGIIANRESQTAYNSSKAAVAMMTKSLASEWVNDNIRVNAIAPGYMKTEMARPLFEEDGELKWVLDLVPMKRLGEPYELGGTIVLLASDASSFTTGSVFVIDGGYTIW